MVYLFQKDILAQDQTVVQCHPRSHLLVSFHQCYQTHLQRRIYAIQIFAMLMMGPTGTGPQLFYCASIGKNVLILTMLSTGHTKYMPSKYADDGAHYADDGAH